MSNRKTTLLLRSLAEIIIEKAALLLLKHHSGGPFKVEEYILDEASGQVTRTQLLAAESQQKRVSLLSCSDVAPRESDLRHARRAIQGEIINDKRDDVDDEVCIYHSSQIDGGMQHENTLHHLEWQRDYQALNGPFDRTRHLG